MLSVHKAPQCHHLGKGSPHWPIIIQLLPVQSRDWQPTTLRLGKNCTSTREQSSLNICGNRTHKCQHRRP
jgi:hypothetical protein